MNCQSFEMIVVDLSRERLMDAGERNRGLAHAGECGPCAARLMTERTLTAGLRALAEIDARQADAPARLEDELRLAFRAQAVPAAPRRGAGQPVWWRYALAGATAMAAMWLITLALSGVQRGFNRPKATERAGSPAADSETGRRVLPAPAQSSDEGRQMFARSETAAADSSAPARRPQASARATGVRRGGAGRRAGREVKTVDSATPDTASAEDGELMTDFISLTGGANQRPLESGQIVRVRVPRATLVSFGLPMNMERSEESVKADVLLGHDGIARAIRFVR